MSKSEHRANKRYGKWVDFAYDSEALRICVEVDETKECTVERQVFYVGALYGANVSETFECVNDVLEAFGRILRTHKRAIVWIHNARYDIHLLEPNIFEYFRKEFGINVKVPRQRPFYITLKWKDHVLKIMDSMNFYSKSLRELAETFGLSEQKILSKEEYEMSPREWNNFLLNNKNLAKAIALKDAEILYKVVSKHHEWARQIYRKAKAKYRHDTVSAPSLAFTLMRHEASRLMDFFAYDWLFSKKYVDERVLINDITKGAYLGGRNEAFVRTWKPTHMVDLDFNSLYPTVMERYEYPTVPTRKKTDVYITEAVVECKEGTRVLPFVAEHEFEDGVRLTEVYKAKRLFTSAEIELIEQSEECRVVSKRHTIYFEHAPVMRDFVRLIYPLKQTADRARKELKRLQEEAEKYGERADFDTLKREIAQAEAIREVVKLFLNSAYGKFGQHKDRRVEVDLSQLPEEVREDITVRIELAMQRLEDLGVNTRRVKVHDTVYTILGYMTVSHKEPSIAKYYMPIASFVTAYARNTLYNAIVKAGKENVYYSDTDSLFVSEDGYRNLVRAGLVDSSDTGELGLLKVEKKGYFATVGKKYYFQFDEKGNLTGYTVKGLRKAKPSEIRDAGEYWEVIGHDKRLKISKKTFAIEGAQRTVYYKEGQAIFKWVPKRMNPIPRLVYRPVSEHVELGYPIMP